MQTQITQSPIKESTFVNLYIRKGKDGVARLITMITYTQEMSFREAFPLTRAKSPTNGKQLAVSVKKKNSEESDVPLDAKIREVCDGGDVDDVIFWFYEEEDFEM
jgi:hypothetical protein